MTKSRLRFFEWMNLVSTVLLNKVGLTADDLPDVAYRDWYDSGATYVMAANRALRYAKEDM